MKTIVALLDFSDTTARILDEACARAQTINAEIVLVHITEPPRVGADLIGSGDPAEQYLIEQEELLGLRDSLAALGVRVRARQIQGTVLETIINQILKLQPALIIVGAHHHGVLHDFLLGDTTRQIVEAAQCAVLVVKREPADVSETTEGDNPAGNSFAVAAAM